MLVLFVIVLDIIGTFSVSQNIIIDLEIYLTLIFYGVISLPVTIRSMFSLTLEVALLSRIIELNFDLLDQAEDNEGFEK